MNLSVVIPLFNEDKENLGELHNRLNKVFCDLGHKYEIIFVDDGSNNGIMDFLRNLHDTDKHVKVVSLDRNYGQANAFLAGFSFASGDFVITMDADLQYQPEDISLFLKQIGDGYDVVGGKRSRNSRNLFSLAVSRFFDAFFGLRMDDHFCTFSALSMDVVKRIKDESSPLRIRQLAYAFGNNKIEIDINHKKRLHGKSKYPFWKYIFGGFRYLCLILCRVRSANSTLFKVKVILT